MIFNSLDFIIFFPIVVIIYFSLPHKLRIYLLLTASYLFYMWWNPLFIILIIISTLADYFIAKKIFISKKNKTRNILLISSILINILILFSFKYADFFIKNLNWGLNIIGTHQKIPYLNFILPVGISFYTFQTISYTIDVFRKRIEPEKSLVKLALYVSFFPQLVAGPIERAERLLPQFAKKQILDFERISYGLKLMVWGFFQKVVIADNLMGIVNIVFANPNSYKGLSIIVAVVFFTFQIYCDFAGYTNIAIGAANIFGIKLIKNFKQPFLATSINDFWKRWHISLTSWFRDYVYISLGGNRVPITKWIFIIFITFIISGLWHGAEWTFIIWGAIHGFIYLSEKLLKNKIKKHTKLYQFIAKNKAIIGLRILATFSIVVFAFIFFRAENFNYALAIIKNMFSYNIKLNFDHKTLLINTLLISIIILVHFIEKKIDIIKYISEKPIIIRFSIYYMILLLIIGLGNWNLTEFIYFQF